MARTSFHRERAWANSRWVKPSSLAIWRIRFSSADEIEPSAAEISNRHDSSSLRWRLVRHLRELPGRQKVLGAAGAQTVLDRDLDRHRRLLRRELAEPADDLRHLGALGVADVEIRVGDPGEDDGEGGEIAGALRAETIEPGGDLLDRARRAVGTAALEAEELEERRHDGSVYPVATHGRPSKSSASPELGRHPVADPGRRPTTRPGVTGSPSIIIVKWRWSPPASPVAPVWPRHLAALDPLALLDGDRREVAAQAHQAVAVVEHHHVAVDPEVAGEQHHAVVGRRHLVLAGRWPGRTRGGSGGRPLRPEDVGAAIGERRHHLAAGQRRKGRCHRNSPPSARRARVKRGGVLLAQLAVDLHVVRDQAARGPRAPASGDDLRHHLLHEGVAQPDRVGVGRAWEPAGR